MNQDPARWDHHDLSKVIGDTDFFYHDDRHLVRCGSEGRDCMTLWGVDKVLQLPTFCTAPRYGVCERCPLIWRHALSGDVMHTCLHVHPFAHTPRSFPVTASPVARTMLPWAWCWLRQLDVAMHHNDPRFVQDVLGQSHVNVDEPKARTHMQRAVNSVLLHAIGETVPPVPSIKRHVQQARLECVRQVMDRAALWKSPGWLADLLLAAYHVHTDQREDPTWCVYFLISEYGAVRWNMLEQMPRVRFAHVLDKVCDPQDDRLAAIDTVIGVPGVSRLVLDYVSPISWICSKEALKEERWSWRDSLRKWLRNREIGGSVKPPGVLLHHGHVYHPPKRAGSRQLVTLPTKNDATARPLLGRWKYSRDQYLAVNLHPSRSMMPDDWDILSQCLRDENKDMVSDDLLWKVVIPIAAEFAEGERAGLATDDAFKVTAFDPADEIVANLARKHERDHVLGVLLGTANHPKRRHT